MLLVQAQWNPKFTCKLMKNTCLIEKIQERLQTWLDNRFAGQQTGLTGQQ